MVLLFGCGGGAEEAEGKIICLARKKLWDGQGGKRQSHSIPNGPALLRIGTRTDKETSEIVPLLFFRLFLA